jgi:hypothetical protein
MPSVVFLAVPGSLFAERFEEAAAAARTSTAVLSLDAPLDGGGVTIGPGSVRWEGVELIEAGAIVIETPLFAWPQPRSYSSAPSETGALRRFVAADREARALAISALSIVAERRPVWNPPRAAFLAASAAIPLDRLEAAGFPVQPWRLEPARAGSASGLVIDSVGSERWHRPSRPQPGEPALVLRPVEGPVWSACLAGGETVGGGRQACAATWPVPRDLEPIAPSVFPENARALAERATRSLGLSLAAVTMVEDGGAWKILHVDVGPDLASWDDVLGGRLARDLVRELPVGGSS